MTLVAAAFLTLQAAPAAEAATATVSPGYVGMNGQALMGVVDPDVHSALMADHGIQTVRFDAPWGTAEPLPPGAAGHRYDWRSFDLRVIALARQGLRWLPLIDQTPFWARGESGLGLWTPPADPGQFAAYAGALARRYGRGGTLWREHPSLPERPVHSYEIWNEPNRPYTWPPAPNPKGYAVLYKRARAAIRAVDPAADVLIGGLGGGDRPAFIRAMWAAVPAIRGNVDSLRLHPYGPDPAAVMALIAEARHALDSLGETGVKIAVTEVGWPTRGLTGGWVRPDGVRAQYLTSVAENAARSDCGVSLFFPHTWVTWERDVLNVEHWYGFVHLNGTPTVSASAYRALAESFQQRFGDLGSRLALCGSP